MISKWLINIEIYLDIFLGSMDMCVTMLFILDTKVKFFFGKKKLTEWARLEE